MGDKWRHLLVEIDHQNIAYILETTRARDLKIGTETPQSLSLKQVIFWHWAGDTTFKFQITNKTLFCPYLRD